MKKFIAVVSMFLLLFATVSCGSAGNNDEKDNAVELTVDNCYYYLSIDDTTIDSSSVYAAGRTYYSATHKITITGAISGLYADCKITFSYGNNEKKEISLNAAGFATFEYRLTDGYTKNVAQAISCEGQIIL